MMGLTGLKTLGEFSYAQNECVFKKCPKDTRSPR